MFTIIKENLSRQFKALLLLKTLLREEFTRLMDGKPQTVSSLEMSIQELMRQVAVERMEVRGLIKEVNPEAVSVRNILDAVEESDRESFSRILEKMDGIEQECAVQASKNQQLAQALLDQSQSLLGFMHKEIQPKNNNTYSARGRYAKPATTQASFFRGRL